ncbi:glycosyltransferase family 4 protein [Oceanisphaera avium]|uniref:glycosyltransferase family 4 protein n=1 Tax=Oceanisphaera avium TaxID=1903694 RepID=UPI001E2AAFFF|nr:glycosyltransferase family 1 protein [Oceanisphaera avium]
MVFLAPNNIIHPELAKELNVKVIGKRSGHLWEQLDLPRYLKSVNSPLLVNLANTAPLFYKNKVSTLHDIAFVRYPESFSRSFRYSYQLAIPFILRSSKKVITVSEFSKQEICDVYQVAKDKVSVIYNAVSDVFNENTLSPVSSDTEEKYIMAVSSINKQKNFHGLIEAFNLLNQTSHQLYIIGSINKNFADPELINAIDKDPRIKLLGRVSDEELTNLYAGASAFVYPSFYEGFGIPPLEAQACGCPVVVSNVASLPEVCGDSALYCAPDNIEDIANKIQMMISDKDLRSDFIEKGYQNINKYSWEASAAKLNALIQEI